MEERDDDDNESAVRALNTARLIQAHALEGFLDEEPLTVFPGYTDNLTPAPSDETHSFSENVSNSESSTSHMVGAAGVPFQPASLLGPTEDEDADDGIEDELEQLRVSEILLRSEMERASSHAQTTLERLSTHFLDATADICTPDDAPNASELRRQVARETQKIKGVTDGNDPFLAGAADRMINGAGVDVVVDSVMESVMDSVLEGCQGYYDCQKEESERRQKTSQRTASQKPRPRHTSEQHTESGSTEYSSAASPSKASSNSVSSPVATKPRQISFRSQASANEFSKERSQSTVKLSNRIRVTGNNGALHEVPVDLPRNSSIPTTELQQEYDSANNVPKSTWHFSKKVPFDESEMPRHIQFKNARLDEVPEDSIPDEAASEQGGGEPSNKPSLLKMAKALSAKWMSSGDGKAEPEDKNKGEDGNAIAGTKSMDSASSSEAKRDLNSIVVSLFDVEDPAGEEEGLEVEAFYQQRRRMTLWERITSPEQHKEWKNCLFKYEWLGIKRVYWVVLVLLVLIMLLIGLTILLTDESGSSSQRSTPNVNQLEDMHMFPPYTHLAFRDPESPQTKAYDWLINDPSFSEYNDERKIQRFAIATLYFSTNGPGWIFVDRVLQYNTDECQWFYSRAARSTPPACAIAGGLIEALDLEGNNLQGTIPPELFLMTNLKHLSLADNQLMSTIPSRGLDHMKNLKTLNLAESGLSGPLPATVGYLSSLVELNLAGNRLTGTLPIEVKFLSNLEELRLQNNGLNGTLPGNVFANLKNLKQMYLFENSFEGPLPPEVGQMQVLEDLFLYKNELSSTLPIELGLLSRLQRLWLDRNRFTGTIPKHLGHLQKLVTLNLFSNALTGTIPATLGSAKALEQLQLNDNQLTGYVPDRLCALLPVGGDNDIVRLLAVDCEEVICDCDCTCPRPDTTSSLIAEP